MRLSDGQSFAIAGLMSSRMRSQIDKIPLLGDLPILGALFRSISYARDESELLVIVTAHLARPMAPHEVPRLPTEDEQNDPNDFELFLLGSEGGAQHKTSSPPPCAKRMAPSAATDTAAPCKAGGDRSRTPPTRRHSEAKWPGGGTPRSRG